MAAASMEPPDWLFNERDAMERTKGFGIAGRIMKDIKQGKDEKLNANLKLITTLSGPKKGKEYARQLKLVLADDKRPIFQFFGLLNLKPYERSDKLDETKLVAMMKEHPDFCTELFRFEVFPQDVLHPLHMLCALSASLSTIKVCFKCCNAALFHDASANGAPIHYAVTCNASFDVIRWLVKKDVDALKLPNIDANMTPLHLACQYEADSATVAFLTDRCPEAARETDVDGMTPLHLACSVEEPELAVIEDLTEVYPDAGIVCSTNGATPLLLAIKMRAETPVLRDLIVSNPACASIADRKGSTPLHRAIETGANIKVLKDLIKANKKAVRMTDSAGNLPVHTAVVAAVKDMAVYQLLARKYSDGLEEENDGGDTPYSLAKKVLRDKDIIEFLNPFEEVDE
jgi:ankyrin repeat protein